MPLKNTPGLEEIAIAAKEYARQYIKKGATQLENNNYPEGTQEALNIAVKDIREMYSPSTSKKEEILRVFKEAFQILIPFFLRLLRSVAIKHGVADTLKEYERKIEILKKYSIGNCGEMAMMALHYIVTHYPSLYAECRRIQNGNHTVLIIGKKKPSGSHLKTWDKDAYICDPWSNQIYRVCEWKQRLEDYTSHFIENRRTRATVPLNATQSLVPNPGGYNSINFYYHGSTYRRNKIKEALYLFRPFKAIFDTECLSQLLSERHLLRDYIMNESLNESLVVPIKLTRRKDLINQSIDLLKDLAKYLQSFSGNPDFSKKYALPVSDQLQKINSAIACLDNLLKGYTSDGEFSVMAKKILKEYPCLSSEKIVVAEAIAKAEDITSFIPYFHKTLKPTLEIERNPNLGNYRSFFISKPITVKGTQVTQQLEKLIEHYSTQLQPS